jgi:hypothetical protein
MFFVCRALRRERIFVIGVRICFSDHRREEREVAWTSAGHQG